MPIHVFEYAGRGDDGEKTVPFERVRDASVQGTLFEIEGVGRALMLAGSDTVNGEVRRVPAASLMALDARARVRDGIYRRVGLLVDDTPCWTYVAGPVLAPSLASGRRVHPAAETSQ